MSYNGYADIFWENLFSKYSLFNIVVIKGFFFYMSLFWLISSLYLLLDIFKFSKYLYSFKVQLATEITISDIIKASKIVLRNQLFGVLPVLYLYYKFLTKIDFSFNPKHTIFEDMKNFFWFCIIEEIWFYTFHRLAHHKYFYKHVHKMHHEYKAPFCLTAQYCSLIEQIVINITPLMLGPLIMQSHPHAILMWFLLSIVSALHSHSDYNFPFMASVMFHDFHHYNYKGNYGVFVFMDKLFNTDKEYNKFKENYKKI